MARAGCLVAVGTFLACLLGFGPVGTLGLIKRRSMAAVATQSVRDNWEMKFSDEMLGVASSGNHIIPQTRSKETDLIAALPGQPKADFKQYAGHVTVNAKSGRALFYYFTEAINSSLPLLLWLNGGPGCSSLGAGGLSVLGPFRINRDGKTLRINPTSWNQEANILFLETPAGVGFSYSNITRESEGGDDGRTAIDNFRFLVNWFERFPEYKGHDFYIAGESYAGAYVPTLAYLISNYNNKANETINLKGIMLGNAYMGDTEHNQGEYDNLWHNGIISKRVHQALTDCLTTDLGSICNDASYDLNGAWQALNFYDIYDPVQCNQWQFMKPPIDSYSGSDILYNCTREPIAVYLNRPEVQDALHVPRPTKPWSWCNMPLHDGYVWMNSTIAYVDFLLKHGTPVMIYNGDADGAVPIAEAKILIKQLQYPMKFQNRPWFSSPIEVGGFTTVYQRNESERLTFATVRGGSHMAPLDEGSRSIHLVRSFLKGEQLPYSNLAPKALYECC